MGLSIMGGATFLFVLSTGSGHATATATATATASEFRGHSASSSSTTMTMMTSDEDHHHPRTTTTTCPLSSDWSVEGKCYFVAPGHWSFVDCQDTVCPSYEDGAHLATTTTAAQLAGVKERIDAYNTYVYVGLFEAGEDESGDWQWVVDVSASGPEVDDDDSGDDDDADGGSHWRGGWTPGQPDNWCIDEDCAILGPAWEGWVDASCVVGLACLCERASGGSVDATSEAYEAFRSDVIRGGGSSGGVYEDCGEEKAEAAAEEEDAKESADREEAILRELHAILAFGLATFFLALAACVLAARAACVTSRGGGGRGRGIIGRSHLSGSGGEDGPPSLFGGGDYGDNNNDDDAAGSSGSSGFWSSFSFFDPSRSSGKNKGYGSDDLGMDLAERF